MSHVENEDLATDYRSAGFITAKKARERSVIAEERNKERAFIMEWLRIREEIEKAISEGRTSIMTSQRLSISPEIVETLIEWGYSVESTECGQQTISW